MSATSCEMCQGEHTVPVLIDDNMETYMCRRCIKVARTEMDIEVLDDDDWCETGDDTSDPQLTDGLNGA